MFPRTAALPGGRHPPHHSMHRERVRRRCSCALWLFLCLTQLAPGSGLVGKPSRAPPLLGKGCICPEPREAADGKPDLRSPNIPTTPPSPEEALSFLRSRAVTGGTGRKAVVLVMANWGNRNLADNLLCSLHAASIDKYLLFASDPESFRLFRQHGYSGAFYDPSVFQVDLPSHALEISTGAKAVGAWSALLRARVNTVRYVLDAGLDVLFTDADVVFHRNVIPELQEATEAKDALFMWDGPTSGRQYPAWANAGFYYLRSGDRTRAFVARVLELLAAVEPGSDQDDQTVLNRILVEPPPSPGAALRYSLLDNSTFLCGHTLKTHVRWPGHKLKESKGPAQVSSREPVAVVHVNWTGSLAEKRRLLLRAGFWHLCKGLGPAGLEQQLRDSGQWFDAEGLANGRKRRRKTSRQKDNR